MSFENIRSFLLAQFDASVVNKFINFCGEEEYEETNIKDDIEEAKDSYIYDYMQSKLQWNEHQTNIFIHSLQNYFKPSMNNSNKDQTSMDVSCETCGQPINSSDWSNNNVKQYSIGLVHAQCPNKLLIANCPSPSVGLLHKLFSAYGTITDISINETFGLIEYDNKQSADNAINAMHEFEMGTNKLSVKYVYQITNHEKQKENQIVNESKSDKSQQYKYDKNALLTQNARDIASLLVPNSKVYKKVYKEWMKLLIQYKNEVIEFIYYSKANDTYNTDMFNYIAIPDYLKALLTLKKDQNAENYVKHEQRLSTLPSQHIIIVYGYIRQIEKKLKQKNYIIPSILIQLCFDYYINNMKFYLFDRNQLIEFDLNDQKHVQTMIIPKKNKSKLNGITSCICIPDLISSDLPLLKYTMNSNLSYYGIFGRDDTNHRFILREGIDDYYYMTYSSTNHLHFEKYYANDYIYCGKEHGIIISDLDGLYQLKLEHINSTKDYKFSPLAYKWSIWDHDGYLRTCYMKGLDKILAIQCNMDRNKSSRVAKCGIFNLDTNNWQLIGDYHSRPYLYCDMVYNYNNRSHVYCLSDSGVLSQFDINKNGWKYLFTSNSVVSSIQNNNKPILWLDNKNTNILYQASVSETVNSNGCQIDIKYTDLRNHNTEWAWQVCHDSNNNTQWAHDLFIADSDYTTAKLFT